jgi:hypothetical protein
VVGHLDLSHTGTAAGRADARTQVGAGAAGHQDRNNHGGRVPSPREPEEGSRCLGLAAALLGVVRAVGDFVAQDVSLHD